ncbi:MAG: YaaC family protein [Candidatus Krumholzibacteriia bacterium]
MSQVRYREPQICKSALDPLQDVVSWLRGLKSQAYTSEILAAKHKQNDANKLRNCSRAISSHVEVAMELLDQAFSGSSRTSYLPIYYSMLNLAKTVVLAKGWIDELGEQRQHGAGWTGVSRQSHDLLTDQITVHERGAIALYYSALVGHLWPNTSQRNRNGNWRSTPKRSLSLRDIYPYIASIGFEFTNVYGIPGGFEGVDVSITQHKHGKWRAEVQFPRPSQPINTIRRQIKLLSGLNYDSGKYVSKSVSASSEEDARTALEGGLRWFLLYPEIHESEFYTMTPRSMSNFMFPEEIPVLLAFFHLGNVVRYDPERLERLFDSRCCGILEILRRHGTYDYLLAVWSYMMQQQVAPVRT